MLQVVDHQAFFRLALVAFGKGDFRLLDIFKSGVVGLLFDQYVLQGYRLPVPYTDCIGYPKKDLGFRFKPYVKNILFHFLKVEILAVYI